MFERVAMERQLPNKRLKLAAPALKGSVTLATIHGSAAA